MQVWINANVVTGDGAAVGRVSKPLVHPASWRVLALAVRNGKSLGHRHAEVPADLMDRTSPKGVRLRMDNGAFPRLPAVDADKWRRPLRGWLTPLGWQLDDCTGRPTTPGRFIRNSVQMILVGGALFGPVVGPHPCGSLA